MAHKKCYTGSECYYCGSIEVSPHEIYEGKNRQLSIRWNMIIFVCFSCHRRIHDEPSQEMNKKLKIWGQREFEKLYPNESFIKIFGRNYL